MKSVYRLKYSMTAAIVVTAAAAGLTAAVTASSVAAETASADSKDAEEEKIRGDTFRLYFLGGQSNMAGFSKTSILDDEFKRPRENIYIFHGAAGEDQGPEAGQGVWAPLRPGHGAGFRTSANGNAYSDSFGPELMFGIRMSELKPDEKIAIVKYARGGSAIQIGAAPGGSWRPRYKGGNDVNQYDHFLAALRNATAFADINGDGAPDRLVPGAIIWMQGEGDASHNRYTAENYEANLADLISHMRAAMRVDDLPVVIGLISDSRRKEGRPMMKHWKTVQAAQRAVADADENAVAVDTDAYDFLADGWHFASNAYADLGRRFAEAAHALEETQAASEPAP